MAIFWSFHPKQNRSVLDVIMAYRGTPQKHNLTQGEVAALQTHPIAQYPLPDGSSDAVQEAAAKMYGIQSLKSEVTHVLVRTTDNGVEVWVIADSI